MLALTSCALFSGDKKARKPLEPDAFKTGNISKKMKKRAAFLKEKVNSKCDSMGMFIGQDSYLLYDGRFDMLAARCAVLGITDAFLSCKLEKFGDSEHLSMLRTLLASLHRRKIRAYAIMSSPQLFANKKNIAGYASKITDFNNNAELQEEMFDGILADTRPDIICGKSKQYKQGVMYKWASSTYGKNMDNDMLMKRTFDILEYMKKNLPGKMSAMQAVSSFYEEKAREGKLTLGKADDFLKYCSCLLLIIPGNNRRDIFDSALTVLQGTKKAKSVLIRVNVTINKYGGADDDKSLGDKSWFKMVKDLEYVSGNASAHKSFRGIAFFNYFGLEKMWD